MAEPYCAVGACQQRRLPGTGFCQRHAHLSQRARDERRGTAASRGYGSRWQRERARFLKANPLCAHCYTEGKRTLASVVDHIVPHRGDYERMWDRDNWQPLCAHHHAVKSGQEAHGKGPRPTGGGGGSKEKAPRPRPPR